MNPKQLERMEAEKAKKEKMKHPDWHKYSGWPPPSSEAAVEEPKPRHKRVKPEADVDSN